MSQEPGGRSRRTAKKVNYSIEQTFSDDDIFEDGPKEAPATSRKKSSRPRKSGGGNQGGGLLESGMSFEKSKPVYTERGYDSSVLPLRERFTFEPEYEDDGTPSIEVIAGRRPIDDAKDRTAANAGGGKANAADAAEGDHSDKDSDEEESAAPRRATRRKKPKKKKKNQKPSAAKEEEENEASQSEMDYEYLIKYKNRSYLHLEWKTAADLESMNTRAKTIYRRFLKKLEAGTEEDLEDPTVDAAYTEPGRILAEEDHEITVELSDRELVKWEKEQKKQEAEESDGSEEEEKKEDKEKAAEEKKDDKMDVDEKSTDGKVKAEEEEPVEIGEPGTLTCEDLKRIISKDEPYYPTYPGSDNAYRDGYYTEPPRKPRPSYLFYQGIYRSYMGKKHPKLALSEIMTKLGDSWRNLSEEQQLPYVQMANEETIQYEKEKALLERAQRPTEMWQPIRRCLAVLDRLVDDPFASIFLEPVPLDVYTDYTEIVEFPMDLGTVRERLKSVKNYMGPEVFARDVRKVWNNCKIYNQHGSQIWHVADYMSKLFERLYHAWVLDFRDRYLRWANPAARPWEMSCRSCNDECKTSDSQMVLCDHCDAMYSINCLKPKLKKVPKGVWHCPACAPKIGKNRTVTILSAVTEQAARKRAEMGDIPKKQVKQKMFLVKWAGLGYEHCTWETQEDINDDAIIAEFRRLEGVTPEEPDMTEKEVQEVIGNAVTITQENAGGSGEVAAMRTQLHAQSRAFQFKKFGLDTPCLLGAECGPKEKLLTIAEGVDEQHPAEVVSCLQEIAWKVSTSDVDFYSSYHHSLLPPLLNGEYDVTLPVTSMGLLLNVGEINNCVAFLGYRQLTNGVKGPAEENRLIRRHNDIIIAVNGRSTVGRSFQQVIPMLKESSTFSYVRFVHQINEVEGGLTTSCGSLGRYLYDDLSKRYKEDRRRLLAKRSLALIKAEEAKDDASTSSEDASVKSNDDSDSDDSDASVEVDSDDEALLQERQSGSDSDSDVNSQGNGDSTSGGENNNSRSKEGDGEDKEEKEISNLIDVPGMESVVCKQESTRHLAYGLLGLDVGYSSDEGGDEDVAHYIDGVDGAFTRADEIISSKEPSPKVTFNDVTAEDADAEDKKETEKLKKKLPVKKTDFSIIGKKAQLQVAVALTSQEPDTDDFDNYPLPSSKQIAAEKLKAEEAAKKEEEEAAEKQIAEEEAKKAAEEAAKPKKKSTTKVEQISTLTSEVIMIWANAEDAATTMQLSLESIQKLLKGTYDADLGDEVGGYRWKYADADAVVTEKASSGRDSKKGRDAYLEFREKLYDPKVPHNYKNENRLRDYQVDGVNWLSSCYYKQHGCILADEMGLGKTVQIVSYLEHLFRVEKIHGPFLVVVPLSTVEHWRREFEGWTDMQCCVYHDRQRVWRDVLREYEWYYEDRPHTPDYLKFNVLVTTYDTLIGDFDVIGDIPWRVSVVDEAHRLRNVKGKLLESMKEISAKGSLKYGYQSRVLMTGTPLQNNTQELWTLLNFIEPGLFRSLEEFEENFGNMANREQVEALQRKISPFMLRRVKEDVAKDIPAKEEIIIDVELTSIQKQYYRAIFEHNHSFLSMGNKAAAPKLMNIQMELRKCCNHPFLLDGVESRELEKRHEDLQLNGEFDNKTPDEQHEILNEYGYVMSSGKMVLLDKLLPKLRAEGHKVLIFSQFVKMLDLISDYCEFRDFRYERLDGRVRGSERQKAIDRFETEEDSFMFLLSTRAGGVGINLTAADICIIYDSDWNPQNDVQAQARCHRIGQTKDVRIYRLVTSRTFEQEMFDRASKKLGLEQAILGTFGQDDEGDKPTSKEMEQLLKRGAYALLEDENDETAKEFVADDIENILEKRTRTRVVEGAKTASWLNKKGMNVTKSKFASESESAGIDVDDPLFWQKVMPDFVTPEILLNKMSEMEEAFENPTKGRPKKGKKSEENDATGLSRGNQKKVNEFMADLKGVMEDIFEQDRADTLPSSEKVTCQTLLLTISVKNKLFNESQRNTAKKLLQRLEGDRRRRCRTSNIGADAHADGDDAAAPSIRKELLIVSSKKKRKSQGRKQKKAADDEEDESDSGDEKQEQRKRKSRADSEQLDEDGFKKHSDDEGDWSDVDGDIYKSGKKSISMKEVKRRREWGAGKDPLKLAGTPWPVFPRNAIAKVLGSLLEEVIGIDKATLGIFSQPVPKDDFPAYYEQIKNPMDYGTMKEKLERGEYRSAQAMQKDFMLVNTNCVQFNAQDSDIVREAQRQTLMRPNLLKEAALKNFFFICDDGDVIEVHDDAADKGKKGKKESTPKKPKGKLVACGECEGCKRKACKKCDKCKSKKRCSERTCTNTRRVEDNKKPSSKRGRAKKGTDDEDSEDGKEEVRKPRIRLRLSAKKAAAGSTEKQPTRKRKATPQKTENGNARKKSRRSNAKASPSSSSSDEESGEEEEEDSMFDLDKLQSEQDKLDGSWDAARDFTTKCGPWRLPEEIETKFKQVAKVLLINLSKADEYDIFKEPVSKEDIPDYHEIITNPMDFGTMKSKVEKGKYGEGSDAAAKFYHDFLLVLDNCHKFNDGGGEVVDEAKLVLTAMPLSFAKCCEEVGRAS